MKNKYAHNSKKLSPNNQCGRYRDPARWISGPDPIDHDKYYAWLKHRSQARYRNEDYEITWEEWQTIWPNELFLLRGRKLYDLCIARIDMDQSWNINNIVVHKRSEQLKRNKEFRKNGK